VECRERVQISAKEGWKSIVCFFTKFDCKGRVSDEVVTREVRGIRQIVTLIHSGVERKVGFFVVVLACLFVFM
jgi:hypothetical protein